MATILDLLRAAGRTYGPGLADAARDEVAEVLSSADAKLRDPVMLRGLVRGVLSGLLEGAKVCVHGVPNGETCTECAERLTR